MPAAILALALLFCLYIFVRRCHNKNLSRYDALSAGIWAMAGGFLGARLFYLLAHLDRVIAYPRIVLQLYGGTASWGAYAGGGIAFWLYFILRRQSFLPYADILASCLGIGPFIGRWGCLLNGCCFGSLSNVPWAISYPSGSYAFAAHVQRGLLDLQSLRSLPVHPFQIYLSLNGFMLFLLFTFLWKKIRFPNGVLFWLYWLTYSFIRFFLEFYRDTQYEDRLGFFSVPQAIMILIFLCSSVILARYLFLQKSMYSLDKVD